MKSEMWNSILKRAAILLLVATIIIFGISEAVYLLQKERISRAPQVIELTIPKGAASQIKQGQALDEIPRKMIFVVGDTLLVNNLDDVAHELGPLWIPPGSSASLDLQIESAYSFSCSFTPSKYLGLTVKEATTWRTRLAALGYGVPPLFMLFFVYSFVIWPVKKEEELEGDKKLENDDFQPEWGWRNQYEDDQNNHQLS